MLGISGITGGVDLPSELEILENPLVLGVAGLMYGVEFFADKIPGFNSLWIAIAIVTIIIVWLIPKLWRGIKLVFRKIASFFGKKTPEKKLEV